MVLLGFETRPLKSETVRLLSKCEHCCLRNVVHVGAYVRRIEVLGPGFRYLDSGVIMNRSCWLNHILCKPAKRVPRCAVLLKASNGWKMVRDSQSTKWGKRREPLTSGLARVVQLDNQVGLRRIPINGS